MTRSILTVAGEEHPNPCEGWKKLCEEGNVSYTWAVCQCSMCERSYEIKEDDEWKPVFNCPFCRVPIGWRPTSILPVYSDRPYTLYDEVQDLKRKVAELERKIAYKGT